MKRLDFLKRLGVGTAAAVVAPKVIGEIIESTSESFQGGVVETTQNYSPFPSPRKSFGFTASAGRRVKWVKHGDTYLWMYVDELDERL